MNKETKLNKLTNIPFIVCVFDRLERPKLGARRARTHTRAQTHTHTHAHTLTHTHSHTHTHARKHTHTHRGAGTGGAEGAAAPPVFFCGQL